MGVTLHADDVVYRALDTSIGLVHFLFISAVRNPPNSIGTRDFMERMHVFIH